MKKRIGQKVIIIIGLVLLSTQIIYPLNINAATLNWDNPNSGKNPYKFKLSDYLNSQMVMQVIGCTGIVNKVAGTLGDLMSGNFSSIKDSFSKYQEKALEKICLGMATGTTASTATIINTTISNVPKTVAEYCQTIKAEDKSANKELTKQTAILAGSQKREECLNGIAYTLAKNQLAAMTKQTMNWVTSGFNGDPLYVRNINNFMNSAENVVLKTELEMFKDVQGNYNLRDYPYAKSFATTATNSRVSAQNFADSTKQDLTNYLVGTGEDAIQEFASDFSSGGWNAWLGLTQHPQNNPLGFTMINSQNIADKQAKEVTNIKEERAANNGVLDQKKCKTTVYDQRADEIKKEEATMEQNVSQAEAYCNMLTDNGDPTAQYACDLYDQKTQESIALAETLDALKLKGDCAEYETITPGSLIKDKVSAYLGSPERQLEIADNINAVLNTLFANLISKLRLDGLSSLNSETFDNVSGGLGSNSWTTPVDFTDVSGNKFAGAGFDENRAFDLTKDLGNTFNHSDVRSLGTWDAKNNITTSTDGKTKGYLVPGRGEANTYYTVKVVGNTKLFGDNYSVWDIDDRAFFDGTTWQNWKKGTTSPIVNRGIIQIQQDYIVMAKELLKVMQGVMPALGKLDYCIPGPNPNWQVNSGNAYEALSNYVSDLKTDYTQKEGFLGDREYVLVDAPSDPDQQGEIYKTYKAIFNGSTLWDSNGNNSVVKTKAYLDIAELGTMNGANSTSTRWSGPKNVNTANTFVQSISSGIFDRLNIFNKEYPKAISSIYDTIQNEFLQYEDTSLLHSLLKEKNPKWLPMAKDGLTITKKMIAYDDEITTATQDLQDAINNADTNINKLELIKSEVGKIIKAAQDRRDAKITEVLNRDYGENFTNNTAYKTKYAECLAEENVDYLDYNTIVVSEKDRCFDKIDNDFDGLVDANDPDCDEAYANKKIGNLPPTAQPPMSCVTGSAIDMTRSDLDTYMRSLASTTNCNILPGYTECEKGYQPAGGKIFKCEWY